jgi:hypothetical protein
MYWSESKAQGVMFKHWGSAGLPGHYSVRGAVCKMKLGFANIEKMSECSVLTVKAPKCCWMTLRHSPSVAPFDAVLLDDQSMKGWLKPQSFP